MDRPGSRPWLRFGEWRLMILIGRLKPTAMFLIHGAKGQWSSEQCPSTHSHKLYAGGPMKPSYFHVNQLLSNHLSLKCSCHSFLLTNNFLCLCILLNSWSFGKLCVILAKNFVIFAEMLFIIHPNKIF